MNKVTWKVNPFWIGNRAEIPGYADALRKRQSLETSNRWKNPKYATKVSNSIKMSIAKMVMFGLAGIILKNLKLSLKNHSQK